MTAETAREPLPGWLLDEVASAGRENLDAEHVARNDGKEDASAIEEVALLQRLGLTSSSIVIDAGAGTGQFTLAVAPVSGHVVAVDVSPVMLDLLRVKVGRMGLGNVAVADAASPPGLAMRERLLLPSPS